MPKNSHWDCKELGHVFRTVYDRNAKLTIDEKNGGRMTLENVRLAGCRHCGLWEGSFNEWRAERMAELTPA